MSELIELVKRIIGYFTDCNGRYEEEKAKREAIETERDEAIRLLNEAIESLNA